MVDAWQILWAVTSGLVVILGAVIRYWIAKMDRKIEGKLDILLCVERHGRMDGSVDKLFKHKHATTGEVIIP